MQQIDMQKMGCKALMMLRLACAGVLAVNALCLLTSGARIAKKAEKLLRNGG